MVIVAQVKEVSEVQEGYAGTLLVLPLVPIVRDKGDFHYFAVIVSACLKRVRDLL